MRIAIAVAFLALLACSDALAPVTIRRAVQTPDRERSSAPWSTSPSTANYIR